MNRLWVPGRDAGTNLDLFFTFAVAGVLGNRIFLVATGYPQLGNGTLHISHAIWGGVMMLIAIVVAVSSLAPGVRAFVAVLGGAGFGWFVDELGKYITRDVNYFFKPTLALIYAIFVVMYFAFRGIRRPRNRPEDVMLNAIEAMRQGILGRLDEPRRAEALTLLDGPRRASLHLTPSRRAHRTRDGASEGTETRRADRSRCPRFPRAMGRRASLCVRLRRDLCAPRDLRCRRGTRARHRWPRYPLRQEWIITVTCVVSLVLALIGFAAMASSRVIGYRWFEASILVSILVTQIFLFHEAQIEATIDLTITLAFWMLLRAAMSVERATDLAVPAAL